MHGKRERSHGLTPIPLYEHRACDSVGALVARCKTGGTGTLATTADRVLTILSLFSGERSQWTVEDAAAELGLPPSTAYRYFKSLAQAELLSSHGTGNYMLGAAVCALDRAMRLHDPLINAAKAEMEALAAAHPETIVLLTRLYKDTVMCVHREGERLTASGYERGRPMPLNRGAASKAILAHLPARTLRKLPQASISATELENHALREELRKIKAQGYSVTRGDIDAGKIGISVPVFRANQALEGSLSLVLDGTSDVDVARMVAALIRSRKTIEANLLVAELQAAGPEQHSL